MTNDIINQCPWSSFEKGSFPLCESRLCEWISQPSNTYSNIAFLVVGLILLYLFFSKKSLNGLSFGLCTLYIGLSSFLAHASGARLFGFFDFAAIFSVFTLALTKNASYSGLIKKQQENIIFIAAYTGVSCILYFFRFLQEIMFATFIISIVTWEIKILKRNAQTKISSSFKKALSVFGVGLIALALDATKTLCQPDNHIFQMHAVWHICNAIALYFIAMHYDQNRKPLNLN